MKLLFISILLSTLSTHIWAKGVCTGNNISDGSSVFVIFTGSNFENLGRIETVFIDKDEIFENAVQHSGIYTNVSLTYPDDTHDYTVRDNNNNEVFNIAFDVHKYSNETGIPTVATLETTNESFYTLVCGFEDE